jgi:hypothetical protein
MRSLFIVFIALGAFAQSSPEPEINDIFYVLQNENPNPLVALERQQVTFRGKASGFIAMTMKVTSEISGAKSPVRLKAGRPLEFVVRSLLSSSASDPNVFYGLKVLNVKKKKRELVFMTGHASPLGASTRTDPSEGSLPVTFTKYGTSSYKLVTEPLKPGEYALGRATMPSIVFCFGVD